MLLIKVATYALVMTKMPLGSSPVHQGARGTWSNEKILLSNPPLTTRDLSLESTRKSNLNNYFNGHVCPSVHRACVSHKIFFRLNRLGITPWLLGSTPGVDPGTPGARSGHFLVISKVTDKNPAMISGFTPLHFAAGGGNSRYGNSKIS